LLNCSYNTRGVDMGNEEPLFADINDKEYKKYLPSNSVKDIEAIVLHLKNQNKYKNSKIFLLGGSEGTIIAPLVALNNNVRIDGLLLFGYCNENLKDTLTWQLSGNSELIYWLYFFDYDKKGYITKEDFEADKYKVKPQLFGDKSFEEIDINNDGIINIEDAAVMSLPHLRNMLNAIENDDDEWLKNNHGVRLTTGWFKEHFALKPTKEILPLLDLPIYIFQGELDHMCPVFYAEDIKKKFDELGKNNLTVNIFEKHDHDLNYVLFPMHNEISKGLTSIFNTADKL
jgi:predicted esterase